MKPFSGKMVHGSFLGIRAPDPPTKLQALLMPKKEENYLVPIEIIEKHIYVIRGEKVMLDEDLAKLYQVETRILTRAVKRNIERFPENFMFQLTIEEYTALRSQIGISSGKTGRRYKPYVFTEHGVLMLSSVLRSKRAIKVNIEIMQTFIRLRHLASEHRELTEKINALEGRYDAQFKVVFKSIRQLINAKPKELPAVRTKKRPLGFRKDK